MAGGIQLAPLLTQMKVDIKTFKSDMDRIKVEAVGRAEEVSKEMTKAAKVGEKMSEIGGKLTKTITLPIIGAGTAAAKFSMDFEDSIAKVSTISEESEVSIGDLRKGILKLSDDTGIASAEIANNVYDAISAGQKTGDAINFVTNSTKLAKAGFAEASDSLDLLTTIMNGYKLKAEDVGKVSDLLIQVQNKGKVTVGELSSSMGKIIKTADVSGVKLNQVGAGYALMTANGIKAAETTTYMSSMFTELSKSGTKASDSLKEATGKSFKELMDSGMSLGNVLVTLDDYAKKSGLSMADMFGSAEAGKAALILADNAGKDFNEMLKDMNNSTGATEEAFKKVSGTTGNEFKKALNDIKNLGIEMGDILMPVVRDVIAGVRGVAEKFKNLSPEMKETIVKTALFAATMGPLLSVAGKTITTFTKLKPVVSGVGVVFEKGTPLVGKFLGKLGLTKAVGATATTALGSVGTAAGTAAGASGLAGLAGSLGTAALAAAPFVVAGAAIVGTGYLIHKEMSKEVIPTVDLFADKVGVASAGIEDSYGGMVQTVQTETVKISDATEKAVGAYMKMDDETTKALYEMRVKNAVVTDAIANDMISKFNNMGETIKTGNSKNFSELNTNLTQFFNESNFLTSQKEQEILNTITQKHNERQTIIDEKMKRISEIYMNAKNNNRAINEAEQNEINSIQSSMRDVAINTLSETEQEAAVIRERMKDYQGRLTAEMASQMITKANETRDKEISAANTKYDGIIKQAERLKAAGDITEEQYNNMKEAARVAKEEQIKKANEACEGVKTEISNATPGIEKEVNTQTGKIKDGYDKLKDNISGFFTWLFGKNKEAEKNTPNVKADGSHYNGLSYVPFDGYTAKLHKGERVLTKDENRDYTQGNNSSNGVNVTNNFYGKVESPYEVSKASKKAMRDLSFA